MKKNNPKKPPRFAERFLNRMLDENISYSASGDIEEAFYSLQARCGRIKSSLWYWFQIMILTPRFLNNSFQWRLTMVKNYIKIAFRNIKKHKGYSLINITGLAIGIACCLLIVLYVGFEMSYDSFHKDADRIYRIGTHIDRPGEKRATHHGPVLQRVQAGVPAAHALYSRLRFPPPDARCQKRQAAGCWRTGDRAVIARGQF